MPLLLWGDSESPRSGPNVGHPNVATCPNVSNESVECGQHSANDDRSGRANLPETREAVRDGSWVP